eukprot:CAMPEP_0184655512 /NCGR_PEP_ID=MMETSP0308-20130426/13109_1 /TAXON_ID=38269 /ORGANISM="Gloeochaete witrockiana, Strain SAG 46.84" /LENGTH=429 /DNA_ID=CAMNT_0027092009 /DNA_START=309 /DNA_END=1598 /DNA_ORIENTATION=+
MADNKESGIAGKKDVNIYDILAEDPGVKRVEGYDLETVVVHGGLLPFQKHENSHDGELRDVSPPIHMTTTYLRSADGTFGPHVYGRLGNPNRDALELVVAQLENGKYALAYGSGMAAASSVLFTLSTNDHLIIDYDIYIGVTSVIRTIMPRWGLDVSVVDTSDPANVRNALKPSTRMLWIETPSNPMLKLVDIETLSTLAHSHSSDIVVVGDNTWATPVIQRPLQLGADVIVHSATKYFGGHSDVTVGVVVVKDRKDVFQRLKGIQTEAGAIPSPFDCWLVHRGIRTLPLRFRAHCANALKVALFLESHHAVAKVYYPGLPSFKGHAIALKQMVGGFGGMVSFDVKKKVGDEEGTASAIKVVAHFKLFTRATSLGGVESLAEHRASIEGPESRTPKTLIRLSIGLESADDLLKDLDQALKSLELPGTDV